MRIYVTEFTKLIGDKSKPIVVKSGFGKDLSLSIKDFRLYFFSILMSSVMDKIRNHCGIKEFKLTITLKFS